MLLPAGYIVNHPIKCEECSNTAKRFFIVTHNKLRVFAEDGTVAKDVTELLCRCNICSPKVTELFYTKYIKAMKEISKKEAEVYLLLSE